MEDPWIFIDDSSSSHHSFSDSDQIDSETEAELYSKIHYEENLSSINCQNSKSVNVESSEVFICPPPKVNDIFYAEEKRENTQKNHELITEKSILNNLLCGSHKSEDVKKSPEIDIVFEKIKPNSIPVKKRKSDSLENEDVNLWSDDSEGINLNESSGHKLNKICNKKSKHNIYKKQNVNEKNSRNDSSDSDSNFVWTEEDSSKNSFKINMLDDTIYLSSSDSDSVSDASSFINKNSLLKNLSMPNIKMGEHSKGLWHINNEDLHRQKKYSQRYHENIDIICSNCNQKGHTHRTCPTPKTIKCFICGGEHLGARCLNRMCSNCYSLGHDRRRCWKRPITFSCHLCSMQGHIQENCPDLWRRYHLTTKPVQIKKGKEIQQDTYLYCWNCGQGGHFGAVCPVPISSRKSFSTWPCVISYDNPEVLLKRRLNRSKTRSDNFNKNVNVQQNQDSPSIVVSGKKKNVYFAAGHESNIDQNATARGIDRRQRRMDMRFKRIEAIVRQQDFPRTPKKKSPQKSTNEVPKFAEVIIRNRLKNRKKNRRRKLKKLKEENLQKKVMSTSTNL